MNVLVYALIAIISLVCAVLLARRYAASGARMLLWSAICFAGLTASNVVLFLDFVLFPGVDLLNLRLTMTAASLAVLVIGFIWEGA
jgi:hypothetical protein